MIQNLHMNSINRGNRINSETVNSSRIGMMVYDENDIRNIRIFLLRALMIVGLFLALGLQHLSAQKSNVEKTGDKYYQMFKFSNAIRSYVKAGQDLSEEGVLNLANACMSVSDFNLAANSFEKLKHLRALTIDEEYMYVQALLGAGRGLDAQNAMEAFAKAHVSDKRSVSYKQNAGDLELITKNDPNISISNENINSSVEDFGPAYMGDKIVFASTRKKCLFVRRNYNWNQKPYLNLYQADKSESGLKNVTKFSFKGNKKWHEASPCFYQNNSRMAFTQSNYAEKSSDGEVKLNIMLAEKVDGKWTNYQPFYLNNKDYSVGHPTLSEDGNVMYFTSDMPGGFGGTDIYRVEKDKEGKWGKALNLGSSINTESNEMFPFWNEARNTLYFASNGQMGLGGLDIFVSEYYGNGQYEPAFNVGAPINTSDDDFGMIASADLKSGYFTSNRKDGKGDDDIYSFTDLMPDYMNQVQYDVLVLDRNSGKPIPGADVYLNPVSKNASDKSLKSSDKNGMVTFSALSGTYKSGATAVAYHPSAEKEIKFKAPRRRTLVIKDTVYLDLIVAQKIILKNVYYDFDKWDIIPSAAAELDKVAQLLNDNPGMKLQLGSHTDARGSERYNLKLSQLRAESARNYLVSKGVESARIIATGYGESQLLIHCPEADCTPAEHRQNRRTEILIPDYGKGEDVKQVKGDYHDGTPDHGTSYSSSKAHGSIYKIKLK